MDVSGGGISATVGAACGVSADAKDESISCRRHQILYSSGDTLLWGAVGFGAEVCEGECGVEGERVSGGEVNCAEKLDFKSEI